MVDADYDAPRLAFLLKTLPVQVLARMRSDWVLLPRHAAQQQGAISRPPRHGGEFVFRDSATGVEPDAATMTDTRSTAPHRPMLGPTAPPADPPLVLVRSDW